MVSIVSAQRPRRAALVFIFVTIALDMMAIGLIVPVLPKLVEDFMHEDTAAAARVFGVFGVVWAAMQFFSMPVMGSLSDRYGRRPVILLSNFGLGLDYVLMALAPNLAWLFVGRVISGITAASISTGMAYVADVTPVEKRASAFGITGIAFGVGFVLGPALGGLLGGIDPRLPFWAAAALSLLNGFYGLFVLPESLPPERRRAFDWRRANPVGSLRLLRSHPGLTRLAGISFIGSLAHAVLPSVFVLYAGFRYGWQEQTVGLSLALVGVSSGIVQGALVGRLVARLGERRTLLTGLAFGVIGFVVYGIAPTGAVFLDGHSAARALGPRGAFCAGADDTAGRSATAGRAAGRQRRGARHRGNDRPGSFCDGLRDLHQRAVALADPRRAVLPRRAAAVACLADRSEGGPRALRGRGPLTHEHGIRSGSGPGGVSSGDRREDRAADRDRVGRRTGCRCPQHVAERLDG